MAGPTKVTYKLPTTYDDNVTALNSADIQSVDIYIRPSTGAAGTYPLTAVDTTFTADANGVSAEMLSAFGILAPGTYVAAAKTHMKSGTISAFSAESTPFTIVAPTPNPPTALSVV